MKRITFWIIGLCLAWAGSLPVYAADLLTVYRQAIHNDPTLLQAEALRAANVENVPLNRAALLPQLTANANLQITHNNADLNAQNLNANLSGNISQHNYQLNLVQPLFNLQSWMALQAAHATAKQADATYQAALQDLIIRVATAYFNVLQAQDILRYTQAEKNATAKSLRQIKDKYQVGLATMTDVYQAQAAFDTLTAQAISAQNNVANAIEALQQIAGSVESPLAPLAQRLPLLQPHPIALQSWLEAAQKYNWRLLADRFAAESAKETVHANFAGHFPTVNAVGGYNYTDYHPSGGFQDQVVNQSDVGLQLNLPLFQGGGVVAKTHQAQDLYVAASDQTEITRRQVLFDTRQAFNNVVAGISKIQADRVAVTSAKSALDSTQAGYEAGTKTILDVLTALQNLYQAQSNLAIDQYTYLNNTLLLKQAVGTLNGADIVAINRWLQSVPASVVQANIISHPQRKLP